MFGLIKRMRMHSERINDFFANAVMVWIFKDDNAARYAALNAAMTAASIQRASMVEYLTLMANDLRTIDTSTTTQSMILNLAREISEKDWSIKDSKAARDILADLDAEYSIALDQADDQVFVRRYSDLFETDSEDIRGV